MKAFDSRVNQSFYGIEEVFIQLSQVVMCFHCLIMLIEQGVIQSDITKILLETKNFKYVKGTLIMIRLNHMVFS